MYKKNIQINISYLSLTFFLGTILSNIIIYTTAYNILFSSINYYYIGLLVVLLYILFNSIYIKSYFIYYIVFLIAVIYCLLFNNNIYESINDLKYYYKNKPVKAVVQSIPYSYTLNSKHVLSDSRVYQKYNVEILNNNTNSGIYAVVISSFINKNIRLGDTLLIKSKYLFESSIIDYMKKSYFYFYIKYPSQIEKIYNSNIYINTILTTIYFYIDNIFKNKLSESSYRLISSLVFGKKSMLSYIEKKSLYQSKLFHFFAISGLHISILIFFIQIIGNAIILFISTIIAKHISLIAYRLKFFFLITITILVYIYLFLIYYKITLFRVLLYIVVVCFCNINGLHLENKSIISITAVILLFINPNNALNLSFLLSYSTVIFIVIYFSLIYKNIKELLKISKYYTNSILLNICIYSYRNILQLIFLSIYLVSITEIVCLLYSFINLGFNFYYKDCILCIFSICIFRLIIYIIIYVFIYLIMLCCFIQIIFNPWINYCFKFSTILDGLCFYTKYLIVYSEEIHYNYFYEYSFILKYLPVFLLIILKFFILYLYSYIIPFLNKKKTNYRFW